jgi:hypothetical protein
MKARVPTTPDADDLARHVDDLESFQSWRRSLCSVAR